MGRMIICHKKKAEIPLYIKEFELHIYTIEELCFCLKKNLHMLDDNIMKENLCIFLEKELELKELAEYLRKIIEKQEGLAVFVGAIMKYTGYLRKEEIIFLEAELKEVEGKSSVVRRKAKADFLLEHKKYAKAVREYNAILTEEEIEEEKIRGNIYHNLGTIYARLFFFKEAAEFYQKAYENNRDKESYECYLMALHMYLPKEEYVKRVAEELVTEEDALFIEKKLEQMVLEEKESPKREEIKEILKYKELGYVQEYYHGLDKIFSGYQQDYKVSMTEG
ncbi:MAG: hypothetical protein IJA36_06885 [Lachnospiraceae bacterium]|nr:hypothetical protein [Lachnospiraceae bacterium]